MYIFKTYIYIIIISSIIIIILVVLIIIMVIIIYSVLLWLIIITILFIIIFNYFHYYSPPLTKKNTENTGGVFGGILNAGDLIQVGFLPTRIELTKATSQVSVGGWWKIMGPHWDVHGS